MEPKPTYDVLSGPPTALQPTDIAERWWLSFSAEHDPTAAAARFIDKTGVEPAFVVVVRKGAVPSMLLVGPLPRRTQRAAAVETQPERIELAAQMSLL